MMTTTTVFIAGSRNIKHLDAKVKERIDNIVSANYDIVVGDAAGADSSIQSYLNEKNAKNVVVYCSGTQPRNNIGKWRVCSVNTTASLGTREFFTAKDIQMTKVADYGLMIWDTKSTGTLSNAIELLKQKKKSVVFINKRKEFRTVSDVSHLEALIQCMSEGARNMADEKIKLFKTINALKHEQFSLLN